MKSGSAAFGAFLGLLVLGALAAGGCVAHKTRPVDLGSPGWSIRHGQAVWTRHRQADPVAGELLVATRPDGECFVQFAKPPFTLASARRDAVDPRSGDASYAKGAARDSRTWLLLADALEGRPLAAPWRFTGAKEGEWCLSNAQTGERVEGYLTR